MDGASGYNFSFPYALAEPPAWAVDAAADASRISLSQVAAHGRYGYRLRRDVAACGSATRPAVCIDVALTNAGEQPFTTPYYMANFFNAGGGRPTGAGYVVQFNMRGAKARLYDHGLSSASWATGLSDLAALDLQARLPRWPARHNAIAPPAPPLTSPPALRLQDGGEEAPDRPIAPPTSTIAFERDLGRGELALAYWNVTGATWDGRFSLSMPVGESAKV